MAVTSGTVYTNAISSEGNTRFRVDWSQTSQSTASNTTTIHWKIYFENHWEYARNAIKVNSLKIDGTTVYSGGTWSNMSYQTVMLTEGDSTIAHNSDGTKTFNLELNCWLYSSTNLSGNADFVLTNIPRYTTVSQSVQSYNETSITIKWTAADTVDYVWRKLGSGSWTAVGSVNATSGTYTVSGLSEGTSYTIYTRVRRKDSQLSTDSSGITQKTATYPYPTSNQSVGSATETSITINWSSDSTIDYVWRKVGSGAWTAVGSANASSGSYTISGLSAGTSYTIQTRLRRSVGQKTTDSSSLTTSTYAYPYATGMPNFTLGNQVTITIYNPLSRSVNVGIRSASGNVLKNISTTGTSVKGYDDADSVNGLYAAIPSATSGTYRITVQYGSTNTDTRTGGTYSAKQSDVKPTIGALTYVDSNTDSAPKAQSVVQDTSILVRNKSIPTFSVTGITTYKSATVSSVKVVVNGTTYNMTVSGSNASVTTGTINSAANFTATVTLTDSRGYTATSNVSVKMADWTTPSAITTLRRRNGFYSETYLTVDATYSRLNYHNAVTITYTATASGETTLSGTLTDNVQATLTCNNAKSWTFTITITDSLGATVTYTRALPRGIPLMFWDRVKNLVGVNRYPTRHSLEVSDSFSVASVGSNYDGRAISLCSVGTLDTVGWYTILELTGNAEQLKFNFGCIIDIDIVRTYTNGNNEAHSITFTGIYGVTKYSRESTVCNGSFIDYIRYIVVGNVGKLQVHYNDTRQNPVAFSFRITTTHPAFTAPIPYVDTSTPSTNYGEHAFATFAAGALPVNQGGTGMNANYKSISAAPSDTYQSYDFTSTASFYVGDGVTVPNYAKGHYESFASDAVLWAVGADMNLYTAYRNNGTWHGQKNASLFFRDTRSVNSTPNTYITDYAKGLSFEFKTSSTIGLPSGSSTYAVLITMTPWSDSSGGWPTQIAFSSGNMYIRYGASGTTWQAWKTIG